MTASLGSIHRAAEYVSGASTLLLAVTWAIGRELGAFPPLGWKAPFVALAVIGAGTLLATGLAAIAFELFVRARNKGRFPRDSLAPRATRDDGSSRRVSGSSSLP